MTRFGVPPGSVIVAVDGSEDADRAVAWAAQQAHLSRRPLTVVHSTGHIPWDAPWLDPQTVDPAQLETALHQAAREVVATACERAAEAAPGIEVTSVVLREDPRMALVDLSTEAHLVAMGSRGRGPLRSALLGSVSASVVRHAHCPVVVCRPPGETRAAASRIVAGADGSPASRPVLEFAFEQASLLGAPLTVMHCFWDVLAATAGTGVVPLPAAEDLSDLRLLLAESVAGLVEKYPDVQVTKELSRGLVDQCLTDGSPDAALVVVGRTAAGRWWRFLHSSCALAVLERARTTVAVVPEST